MAMPAGSATRPRATIFEVEREVRWRIWALFGLLLLVLFVVVTVPFAALVLVFVENASTSGDVSVAEPFAWAFGPAAVVALAFAIGAWVWAGHNVRDRLVKALHARPLDPADSFHQRLVGIVDELRIAAGMPAVEAMVVPSSGMNAFAFSDLRGGGCVGVTEGMLGRLSRQQLEAVMAHELAHLASRDCVTATRACMLFSATFAMGEWIARGGGRRVRAASDVLSEDAKYVLRGRRYRAAAAPSAATGGGEYIGFLLWPVSLLLFVFEMSALVVNSAISRQREFAADLAAAKYTRDPESLAEALRIIGRHDGGRDMIPFGLSPLCIRPSRVVEPGTIDALLATHPPLEARIARLKQYAGQTVDAASMAAGDEAAAFRGREHVERPPAATADLPAAALRPIESVSDGQTWDCPVCRSPLQAADYEGTGILVCRRCGGRLVTGWQVDRILARRSMGFTEAQHRTAVLIAEEAARWARPQGVPVPATPRSAVPTTRCPQCGGAMVRHVFSYGYPVEVDHCKQCEWRWFDRDELEVLQILVERQVG